MTKFNPYAKAVCFMLLLHFSVTFRANGQLGKFDLYISPGVTLHNYFKEGNIFPPDQEPFFTSVNAPLSIGIGVRRKDWRSELEFSYYTSFVSTADTLFDLVYLKNAYTLDYSFLVSDFFKVGIFYSIQDRRYLLYVPVIQGRSPNFKEGLGLDLSYIRNGYRFSLRKELVYEFPSNNDYGGMEGIDYWWTLRISKDLPIDGREPEKSDHFSLQGGLLATGNTLRSRVSTQSMVRLEPTLGAELIFPKLQSSLYVRRSVWYGMEAYTYNFPFSAQTSYAGVAYHLPVSGQKTVKLGVHHVWLRDKAHMFLDFLETGQITLENIYYRTQNLGIGFDFRYTLSKKFDAVLNCDLFYKANPRIGTGLNENSLRLGLLYNLY